MSRWQRGEADIEQLIAAGHLQVVTGSGADGAAWLANTPAVADPAGNVLPALSPLGQEEVEDRREGRAEVIFRRHVDAMTGTGLRRTGAVRGEDGTHAAT